MNDTVCTVNSAGHSNICSKQCESIIGSLLFLPTASENNGELSINTLGNTLKPSMYCWYDDTSLVLMHHAVLKDTT